MRHSLGHALHGLLQGAREVLRDSVLPSLTDSSVQHALGSATLDTQLLGFETGGEQQRGGNADVHEQLPQPVAAAPWLCLVSLSSIGRPQHIQLGYG